MRDPAEQSRFDWKLLVLAACQALLAFLGVFVSVQPVFAASHVGRLLTAFFVLALIGIAITHGQSRRSAQTAQKLEDALETIAAQTMESTRLQGLNTDLQRQLLQQSATITELAHQAIHTATGGDSFACLYFTTSASDSLLPDAREGVASIKHVGEYPLYDLDARVTDMALWTAPSVGGPIELTLASGAGRKFSVGTLAPGLTHWVLPPLRFADKPELHYIIQFSARNGVWFESLMLRRESGRWVQQIEVTWPNETSKAPWHEAI